MAKQRTILQFRKAVLAKVNMNAWLGFWLGFFYRQYQEGVLSYEEAIEQASKLGHYTGV